MLPIVLLAIAAGIVSSGYWLYRSTQDALTNAAAEYLRDVAEFKQEAIASWRRERLADGQVLSQTTPLGDAFRDWLGGDSGKRRALESWARTLLSAYRYSGLVLLDTAGRPVMAVRTATGSLTREALDSARKAVSERRPILALAQSAEDGRLLQLVLSSFLTDSSGEVAGAVLILIDTGVNLLSSLQRWQTRWDSTKSVLMRVDGDAATPLTTQASASMQDNADDSQRIFQDWLKSAGSQEVMLSATDADGTPVYAVVEQIPGTDWLLIVKVDRDELLASLRREAGLTMAAIAGLLLALATLLLMVWRQRNNQQLRLQLAHEQEQRRLNDALRSQDETMRVYFDKSLIGMAITSPEKGWVQVNRALTNMLGYSAHDLTQTTWPEITHPDDLAKDREQFDRVLAGEIEGYQLDKRFIRKDGEVLRTTLAVAAVRRKDGTPEFFVAQILDNSARHAMEERLQEDHAQLEALFDGIDDVIYVADPETYELLYANDVSRKTWGDDIIGRKCFEALQDRDSPCPFCTNDKIFGEYLGRAYRWEFRNETNQRWYAIADKAIRWSNGKLVRFELASDISEQKAIALQRVNLEKLGALGRLTAGMAHELNNPLMGIINGAQFCLAQTDTADERHEILEDIERETRRCVTIVRDLLAFSHAGGSGQPAVSEADPEQLLAQVIRLLDYRIRKEGIEITTEVEDRLGRVRLQPEPFQQVIINLLSNAIDAVEGCTTKHIVVRLSRDAGNLVMKVRDTGVGISEPGQQQMFDPFYTTKPTGKGTGLGLSTSWSIIQEHGGSLDCFSQPGRGTTMTVMIPQVAPNAQKRVNEEQPV
jgi:PAS domain S-box-containing protein